MDPKGSVNDSKGEPQNNYNDETQGEDNKENIINSTLPFKYLEKETSPEQFIFEGEEKTLTNTFSEDQGKYDYIICILMKDDSQKSSEMLDNTLKSIYSNRDSIDDLGISTSTLLICVFVKEIKGYSLFNKDEFIKVKRDKNNSNIYLYFKAHKEGYNSTSSILIFSKPDNLNEIESLRCYYLGVIHQLKLETKLLFSSVITAGVECSNTSLKKLMINSYIGENNGSKGLSTGIILSKGEGLYAMVEKYERIHFNIYDMNFYGMTAVVPVSSLLSTIAIDDKMFDCLKNYYLIAEPNITIDYHDYNLALNFFQNNKYISYISDEVLGELNYLDLDYLEYQEMWVNRYSGYYGNFFTLLKCYSSNFNLLKSIMLTFQIIGMILEFIYPSLSIMVIYAIFYEAFGILDYRVASFFTLMYICILTASGMCSLVSKKPKELKLANYFLYIFMEVYYVFVLICSVVAMDNINKNKNHDEYKFNKAAISCIIIFTFIPYILPLVLKFNLISSNILNMLTYIGLGASCSSSNFLMAEVWNAAETIGGSQIEERKSIVLIIFFLYNLFFGFLAAFNYTREKRANCVMGFGILYLIYNFFKIMGIILKIIGKSEIDPRTNSKIIDKIKNELGKEGNDDIRSEEKTLKKSSQLYNSGNPYQEDNTNIEDYNHRENNINNNNDSF